MCVVKQDDPVGGEVSDGQDVVELDRESGAETSGQTCSVPVSSKSS